MVKHSERVSQLCKVIDDYPTLWDVRTDGFKKGKHMGRNAKRKVKRDLLKVDADYWSQYSESEIHNEFKRLRRGYEENQKKEKQSQVMDVMSSVMTISHMSTRSICNSFMKLMGTLGFHQQIILARHQGIAQMMN